MGLPVNIFEREQRSFIQGTEWETLVTSVVERENCGETCAFVGFNDHWALGSSEKGYHLFSMQALALPLNQAHELVLDTSLSWRFFFVYLSPTRMEVWNEHSHMIDWEMLVIDQTSPGVLKDGLLRAAEALVRRFIARNVIRVDRGSVHLVRAEEKAGSFTLRPVAWKTADSLLEVVDRVQGVKKPLEIEPWLNGYEAAPEEEPPLMDRLSTEFDFGFDG